ncbi:MAG: hypothetical protein O7C65_03235 [Planctomycetota bacterium]|nr:hypothetical protein [Planctomycetota bacterium]MCZ6542207.1 hypothetical protein [Planctomycetota bacterium]MCZ6734786.1 hypothetical protein [Planctomycetota bacterium]
MKRGLFTLAIILLLGALLNIGFAHYFWWFGERPPPFDPSTYDPVIVEPRQRDLAVWNDRGGSNWPDRPEVVTETKYLGVTFRGLHAVVYDDGYDDREETDVEADFLEEWRHRNSFVVDIIEAGWPMRCVASETWWEMHGVPKPFTPTRGFLIVFGYQLPSRVFWLGMLFNQLFFVAVLAAVACSWVVVRPWARRTRGCCLACGYDLRGDFFHGCPECGWRRGKAVPPPSGVAR